MPPSCDPNCCSPSTDSCCHGDCTRAQPYATSDNSCCSSSTDSCFRGNYQSYDHQKKKLAKQSKVGLEIAMPTRPTPTQEPSTSKTTATQSRAHNSSDPTKPCRLQLINDMEGCRTGQRCTVLCDGKIYPDIMRRVMDITKETVVVQCVQIVGQNRFRWPLKDDTAVYEL